MRRAKKRSCDVFGGSGSLAHFIAYKAGKICGFPNFFFPSLSFLSLSLLELSVIFTLNIPVNRRGDWRPVAIKGNAVESESCEVKSN